MALTKDNKPSNGTNLGFESECWKMADKLRNNLDAAEYKHVVLGLIFLKYISDAFTERRTQLEYELGDTSSKWFVKEPDMRYMALEDPDEYRAERVFWVPKEGARL
ncbi:MAG: type I restriction-modification system subunit M N-terminal domain-containing protein [Methanoregula sp.]|nr:type I restriction-modification system subunit M N-terminal domain-containing protein [Methanoregula sp.]